MKAYPLYKASGIEWLCDIPSHWDTSKLKYYIAITNGADPQLEGDIAVYGSGVTSFKTCGEYKEGPAVLLGRKGTINIPRWIEGRYWNVDTAFDCKSINDYNLRYFYYNAFIFDYDKYKSNTAVPSMTQGDYNNFILPIPPVAEQQAIAAYLDDVTGKIDALISEKRKQVNDIRIYRTSLITETVTRGLNLDAPLRPSGIEWLGNIPEHWICTKAQYYIDVKSGDSISKENINSEDSIPVYGGGEIIGYCKEANIKKGTIIIGRVGARCGCVRIAKKDSWATDNALIVTTNQNPYYIDKLFEAANLNRLNESNAQPLITATKVKELGIPLPPVHEQQEIADFLDAKTAKIDELISELTKQIDEFTEYKQAVITEAVTGKVDVRDYKPTNRTDYAKT